MRVLTQRIISCCKGVTVRCKENLSDTLEYLCKYKLGRSSDLIGEGMFQPSG